jgi:HK97 family phage prohead protease
MAKDIKQKQFTAKQVNVDDESRTITAEINTAAIDRAGEIVLPKGAIIENYMKNPVVLYAHDYSGKPWAKAIYIDKKRKSIVAKVKVAETEEAEQIYQLYKGGFLSAFSIGFNAIKGHAPTPDEIRKYPEWADARFVYDEWEMLEFSAVPVPCNPEALVSAVKSKSIKLNDNLKELLGIEKEQETNAEPERKEPEREIYTNKDVDIAEIIACDAFYTQVGNKDAYGKFALVEGAMQIDGKPIDILYGVEGKQLDPVMQIYNGWDEQDVKAYCKANEIGYINKNIAVEKDAIIQVDVIKSSEQFAIEPKRIEIEPEVIPVKPYIKIEPIEPVSYDKIAAEVIARLKGKMY